MKTNLFWLIDQFFGSINILTNESLVERECNIRLFFLQFNIHLDLKTDNQIGIILGLIIWKYNERKSFWISHMDAWYI